MKRTSVAATFIFTQNPNKYHKMAKFLRGIRYMSAVCLFFHSIEPSSLQMASMGLIVGNKTSNVTPIYRVVAVMRSPYVMRDALASRGFKGFNVDLMDKIAEILKFEYVIYEAKDDLFGIMNDKGEWSGVMRELIDNKADIGLTPLSITSERENFIDFTVPFPGNTGLSILMKRETKANSLFEFASVLEWKCWLCIAVVFLSVSSMMWMIDRWSPCSRTTIRNENCNIYKKPMKMTDCFWISLLSLTPNGVSHASNAFSGKLVIAFWWLFGFIIIAAYTANLAAFLTVTRLDRPIESLEDLSNQFKIKYSVQNGSATMMHFRRMSEIENGFHKAWLGLYVNNSMSTLERSELAVWEFPLTNKYMRLWRNIQYSGMPSTIQEGVERVRQSTPDNGFAFLGDALLFRYFELTSCDLKTIGADFAARHTAMAIQDGSPLKEPLDNTIFQLIHNGYMDELEKKWWNAKERATNCKDYDDVANEVSIESIGGLFILLLIGIGASFVALISEYFWFKHYKRPKMMAAANRIRIKRRTLVKTRLIEGGNVNYKLYHTI